MELLKFNKIFSDEDISNYDLFIKKLKQVKENGHTTKEILGLIYQYYEKYVTYNYDELQIIKINNCKHPEITDVQKKYSHSDITTENAEQIKQEYISDLNKVFLQLEGRTLTPKTIELLFGEFGTVVHHEERDIIKYLGKTYEKKEHKDAYDEIKGIKLRIKL